jgi:hypothetical protein
VTGQTEEYSRVLDWVNEAWMIIQRKHERHWLFMRATAGQHRQRASTPTAPPSSASRTWAVRLNFETGDTFRVYNTAQGIASETFMDVIDYDDWRDRYLIGALRTRTSARQRGRGPDGKLYLGPIPSAGWTVTGEYYRAPTEMVPPATRRACRRSTTWPSSTAP